MEYARIDRDVLVRYEGNPVLSARDFEAQLGIRMRAVYNCSAVKTQDGRYVMLCRTNQLNHLTLLWGALAMVMGLLFMEIEYAQIVWGKLMGISTNGILGLMALAFLPFRVNKWAAMAGFAFSYVCLFVMMGSGINFLLWPVIGNTVCFLVGLFLHPLFSRGEADE